jgi:bacillopeptidase F
MTKSKQGSRLSRTLEQQSKKQLYIFFLASIVLVATSVFFGPRILDFIGTTMINSQSIEDQEDDAIAFVTAPHFSSLPQASDTNKITVKGSTNSDKAAVELFVNNRNIGSKNVTTANTFEFTNVSLQEGQNVIKGRTIVGDRKSEFTKEHIVLYTKEPPKLDEVSPGDGSEFRRGDQEIRVSGKTDQFATVTVNGFTAIVDQEGYFSYFLKLTEGDNKIVILSKNRAGKETSKEITVRFSP